MSSGCHEIGVELAEMISYDEVRVVINQPHVDIRVGQRKLSQCFPQATADTCRLIRELPARWVTRSTISDWSLACTTRYSLSLAIVHAILGMMPAIHQTASGDKNRLLIRGASIAPAKS
jgi:hypothetical protein